VAFRPIEGDEDKLPFSAVWLHDNDNPALRRFLSLARAMSKTNSRPDPPTIRNQPDTRS
jgi:hypothetical protein